VFADAHDIRRNDRIKAVIAAALFEGALAYVLVVGLGAGTALRDRIVPPMLVGLLPEKPPAPPPKKKPVEKPNPRPLKEGAASPPNLKATPTEIVRPPRPPVRLPPPPPVAAAPIAGPGAASSAGAAPIPGPGTGSGGQGNGTGSGNGGNGPGGGGNGGGGPPRWVKGEIKDKDYPRESAQAGAGGTVFVRFAVETNGRATDCTIMRSSGHEDIDETTCRLIEDRFRYKPGTDRSGRPVRTWLDEHHTWSIQRRGDREPADDDEPDNGD
jgi:protein TonB